MLNTCFPLGAGSCMCTRKGCLGDQPPIETLRADSLELPWLETFRVCYHNPELRESRVPNYSPGTEPGKLALLGFMPWAFAPAG